MNKIILVAFALFGAVVVAEPPSSYGAPSFSSFSSGGGYDDGGNDGAQFVDEALLARVAQIIEQSESSSRSFSAPSSSYGAPSDSYGPPPSSSYGAPSPARFGGGGISLGRPERAQRVAEFSTSSGGSFGGFRGGFSGGYN